MRKEVLAMDKPKAFVHGKALDSSAIAGAYAHTFLARLAAKAAAMRMPVAESSLLDLLQLRMHKLPILAFIAQTSTSACLPDASPKTPDTDGATSYFQLHNAWTGAALLLKEVWPPSWVDEHCGAVTAKWQELSAHHEPADLEIWIHGWLCDLQRRMGAYLQPACLDVAPPGLLAGAGPSLLKLEQYMSYRLTSKHPNAPQHQWWSSCSVAEPVRWFHNSLPAPPGAGQPKKPQQQPKKPQQPKKLGSQKPRPAPPAGSEPPLLLGGTVALLENVHYQLHKTEVMRNGPRKGQPVRIFLPSDMPCPFAKGNPGRARLGTDGCRMFAAKGTCWRCHPDAPAVTGKNYTMPPLE
jgi:hypothetical protein